MFDSNSRSPPQWRTEGLQRPGANACIGAPPPPPELAPPLPHRPTRLAPPPFAPPFGKNKPFGPGKKSTSKKKRKKGLQPEKDKKDPLMHRESGALGSAAFKISPYKLGGRPLQGWRPGAMVPPRPPPSVRHCPSNYCNMGYVAPRLSNSI